MINGPFRSWAMTHCGTVRAHNEDSFVDRPDLALWAVADGAGGHASGEIASGMLAETLDAIPPGLSAAQTLTEVRGRTAATHDALRERAGREAEARGVEVTIASTLVVLVARQGHYACLWAGDSRAYLLRGGRLTRLTRDHSLVQALVDAAVVSEAEAEHHPHANIITRAVGAGDDGLELDKVTEQLVRGDRFLLCSDGVTKCLDDDTLLRAMHGDAPARTLIDLALEQGARDNVTAVIVEVTADDDDDDTLGGEGARAASIGPTAERDQA